MSTVQQTYYVPKTDETQRIDATSSAQSTAFTYDTFIRIASEDGMYVEIGLNPTATTSSMLMPPDHVEYMKVPAGYKVALLAVGTNKIGFITPLGL